ncbi:MAG TPA: DUF2330 domain-containing protein, partial [Candidatus Acidoferrales bacterium]|nr:DUF2330 domain-containing protein [Candidatus Acidoferrales bacterium]
FDRQVQKADMRAVFTEYAWDMNWCDPCAADPLSTEELRSLGVFWMDDSQSLSAPAPRWPMPLPGARNVFVTRMHVRYDAQHFPEDLVLQETADRNNFQARYVLRHAWKGSQECPATEEYRRELTRRNENEAQQLADLTGWQIAAIRAQMNLPQDDPNGGGDEKWWRKLWRR